MDLRRPCLTREPARTAPPSCLGSRIFGEALVVGHCREAGSFPARVTGSMSYLLGDGAGLGGEMREHV